MEQIKDTKEVFRVERETTSSRTLDLQKRTNVKTKTKMLVYNVYVIVLEMSGVGQHVERPTHTSSSRAHSLVTQRPRNKGAE